MAANGRNSLNALPFASNGRSSPANHALGRWGIVLAGGEGTRMRRPVSNWLAGERPKQYCAFVGSRSMLEHTIDRARSVVSQEHVVTIIGRGHRKFLTESAKMSLPGLVLEQPENLGTAPGVFLPTAYVLADNPEATVVLLPSDHFVYPEERFCEQIVDAFDLAEKHRGQIILVGAIPDRAETDYGWIAPAKTRTNGCRLLADGPAHVASFQEKPCGREARALLRQGCLWNTMVLTVKAETLWTVGRQCLPDMMRKFDAFLLVLRAIREGRLDAKYEASALASIYNDLTPADLSRDVLQHVSEQSMVLRMDGVDWCDWGRPQRVAETLATLGRRPVFPLDASENALESTSMEPENHE